MLGYEHAVTVSNSQVLTPVGASTSPDTPMYVEQGADVKFQLVQHGES